MTDLVDRLALIVDAKTDNAVSSIRKLSLEEKAAAERTDVLKAKIADLETRMARSATGGTAVQQRQLAKLNGEYKALNATLASTASRAGRLQGVLSKVGLAGLVPSSTLGAVGKAAPGLLAGAAVFGAFEFVKSGIDNYTNLANEIRNVQRAASSSAPDASRLVAITHDLGLDSGVAAQGLFRLGKNIDQTPEKLAAYNIAIARTKDGNTDLIGTLENVAEAYQNTADPARRAGLVYQAFGRAGAAMLPILAANKEQLQGIAEEAQKQGRIFSDDDLQRARDYQIATRELSTAWQSFGIAVARDVLPVLTTVEHVMTKIGDVAHKGGFFSIASIAKRATPWSLPLDIAHRLGFHFGGGGDAEAEAARQLAADANAAQTQALQQQALGTLAGAFDVLAGPQNIRQAKQTLRAATQTLKDARTERLKALRDLADARRGDAGASAAQVEAAVARVQAAEQRLQTAQYVGGPGVASARASLLSAQNSLNKLRAQGGVDTDKLAAAEERLHRANRQVAEDEKKLKASRKGVHEAHGLTADQALDRITKQARDQAALAKANLGLARQGATADVIAGIDKLNQQIPGTLKKVAHTATRSLVQGLNERYDDLNTTAELYAQTAANPDLWYKAGQSAGGLFGKGWRDGVLGGLREAFTGLPYPTQGPRSNPPHQLTPGGVVVNGNIVVQGKNAQQVAREIARKARHRALSNGEPDPFGAGTGGA